MTTIKATCPLCGDVDLTPAEVRLTVSDDWATYTFTCGGCLQSVEKSADTEVVALLSSAGVVIDRVPAEVLERHSGGPIDYDDILDLVLWLSNHDVIVPHLTARA